MTMDKVWYKSELIFSSGPSFNDFHYIIPPRIDELKELLGEEFDPIYGYSEHYRGIRLTRCDKPHKEWFINKIKSIKESIESLKNNLKFYNEELHKPD